MKTFEINDENDHSLSRMKACENNENINKKKCCLKKLIVILVQMKTDEKMKITKMKTCESSPGADSVHRNPWTARRG